MNRFSRFSLKQPLRKIFVVGLFAAALPTAALIATPQVVSAVSGKCSVAGEVRSGKVCLPSNSRGSLTWQIVPVSGKRCLVAGTVYQQVGCTKIGRGLVWNTYGNRANWLCRPDTSDVCDESTDVTFVSADLSVVTASFPPAVNPKVDCFYVYPTSSDDQSLNSDLTAGSEKAVVLRQAARFSSVCRMFVPTYRSVTLTSMLNPGIPGDREQAWNLAYSDVRDAWNQYLANDNKGRGVILLGHSQGSTHLVKLIDEVIDPTRSQRNLLVSAVLLGRAVSVPRGQVVGGVFASVPLCRAPGQTGCVITYAAFPADVPPPLEATLGLPLFIPDKRGVPLEAGCTNPATLQGGSGPLSSAFASAPWAYSGGVGPTLSTPFMSFPGLVSAECSSTATHSYLKVSFLGDPADQRVDRIEADLGPANGLHSFDWDLAALTILDVVKQQVGAFLARR